MISSAEKLISLGEASKATPYSSNYLGLLIRKGRLEGEKREGKWLTSCEAMERYLQKVAEASYAHQDSLNVRVPAEEMKKASISLKWALILTAVVIVAGTAIFFLIGRSNRPLSPGQYEIVRNNEKLIIYLDNPEQIKSVTVMTKRQ
jgi:hypothetical protein